MPAGGDSATGRQPGRIGRGTPDRSDRRAALDGGRQERRGDSGGVQKLIAPAAGAEIEGQHP